LDTPLACSLSSSSSVILKLSDDKLAKTARPSTKITKTIHLSLKKNLSSFEMLNSLLSISSSKELFSKNDKELSSSSFSESFVFFEIFDYFWEYSLYLDWTFS
jgi:hypothetical protein